MKGSYIGREKKGRGVTVGRWGGKKLEEEEETAPPLVKNMGEEVVFLFTRIEQNGNSVSDSEHAGSHRQKHLSEGWETNYLARKAAQKVEG